jgi:hypothetical protein
LYVPAPYPANPIKSIVTLPDVTAVPPAATEIESLVPGEPAAPRSNPIFAPPDNVNAPAVFPKLNVCATAFPNSNLPCAPIVTEPNALPVNPAVLVTVPACTFTPPLKLGVPANVSVPAPVLFTNPVPVIPPDGIVNTAPVPTITPPAVPLTVTT